MHDCASTGQREEHRCTQEAGVCMYKRMTYEPPVQHEGQYKPAIGMHAVMRTESRPRCVRNELGLRTSQPSLHVAHVQSLTAFLQPPFHGSILKDPLRFMQKIVRRPEAPGCRGTVSFPLPWDAPVGCWSSPPCLSPACTKALNVETEENICIRDRCGGQSVVVRAEMCRQ